MIDRATIDAIVAASDGIIHLIDEIECGSDLEPRFVIVALAGVENSQAKWARVFASVKPAAECLPGFDYVELRGRQAAELRDLAITEIEEYTE
tara:strand:- start:185 stop:463 length:279 start_codon:yes stop_codon:yes gene_type:complete